jgi:hypothetical protein
VIEKSPAFLPLNMAAISVVIFSVFALIVSCFTQSITTRAKLPLDEPTDSQHVLSPEPENLDLLNVTLNNLPNSFGFLPTSHLTNHNRVQRGVWKPLKKRNNYCFSNTDHWCSDDYVCCLNTAKNTGWCCSFTLACDVDGITCSTPTYVQTISIKGIEINGYPNAG